MPLGSLPGGGLRGLLRGVPIAPEDPATARLMRRLRRAGRRWFSRAEFLAMCRWKSPRTERLWSRHSPAAIRRLSAAVLAARSERRRMALLTALSGVGVPTASAILTLLAPRRYGVLDIRVWQLLHALGAVRTNPRGRAFTLREWEQYLAGLRAEAGRRGVPARALERTLFALHRALQAGPLYDPPRRRRRRARPAAPAAASGTPRE